MRHIIVILGIFYCNLAFGQVDEPLIRKKVLESNIVDSVFVFGKWTEKKGDEAHIKYLGQVLADNGEKYKVMTCPCLNIVDRFVTYFFHLYFQNKMMIMQLLLIMGNNF
ncbi:hypothetical protein [Microbacter margulisiae]|uniref:Uncharacterized protein n=1 Tax=Microbacter margulisiae TaxID=1350067 RepID=A0A7W5DND2_9PORP|nr:hypothetical protein [Microbacter margulisiae]MBB3186104.1 hypothetical protein [Microbacter margulisiae]